MTDLEERSRPPGIVAQGIVSIGARMADRARQYSDLEPAGRLRRLAEEMYQIPIVVPILPIVGGSGVLQIMDPSGPNTGYYWSVRRITAQGFTAGTVTAYRNPTVVGGAIVGNPEIIPSFTQQGTNTFGRGEVLLNPNDWIGWSASGITLAAGYAGVQIQGTADCFPSWLLPEYLM